MYDKVQRQMIKAKWSGNVLQGSENVELKLGKKVRAI